MEQFEVSCIKGMDAELLANAMNSEESGESFEALSRKVVLIQCQTDVRVIDTEVGMGFRFRRDKYADAEVRARLMGIQLGTLSGRS